MKWIQVPVAILSLSSASLAHASADEAEGPSSRPKASLGADMATDESPYSPLRDVLQHFDAKPIRVVAQERCGDDTNQECCNLL